MAEARVILTRGDFVLRNARLSDDPDDWRSFRRVLLPEAFAGFDLVVEHGAGRDADVVVSWGEKKGQRMAVEAGETVLLVDEGTTLEVIHHARPIKFRP
jgi:hypothetical protein